MVFGVQCLVFVLLVFGVSFSVFSLVFRVFVAWCLVFRVPISVFCFVFHGFGVWCLVFICLVFCVALSVFSVS